MPFPSWSYYPRNVRPPAWAFDFVRAVEHVEEAVSTAEVRDSHTSDRVLSLLAPSLVELGYAVETGKARSGKIRRPVLFGDDGVPSTTYEIDAFHDDLGIVVEVEAGRGARGNAVYRDIVRASLILDAHFLAVLVPVAYRHKNAERTQTVRAFDEARRQFDAIYASQRLRLPFEGTLLVGY